MKYCTYVHSFIHSFIVVLLALFSFDAIATTPAVNTKFGKPTQEELEFTTYDADPEAEALVLSRTCTAWFDYDTNMGFVVMYKYTTRVKVLKPNGTDCANVEISYYKNEKQPTAGDQVYGIKAYSYNLTDGKVVKDELKKNMIFDEEVYERHHRLKFSIPNVKAGSVIEYQYEIKSPRISHVKSWYAQFSIPLLYSQMSFSAPEYFHFVTRVKGYERIETSTQSYLANFMISGGGQQENVSVDGKQYVFTTGAMPAMKEDDYTVGVDDYIAHVDFEMQGVQYPRRPYEPFTTTWEDVDKFMLDSRFGNLSGMKNPYPEAMSDINSLADANAKALAIAKYVDKKIKWDKTYRLATDAKKEIGQGAGSNATINFVVMAMLRDAGVECFPAVLQLRRNGVLMQQFPTSDNLDTFVVGYKDENGNMNYMDGSQLCCGINVLPVQMLVGNARIISKNYTGEQWVNLENVGKNLKREVVVASLSPDGTTLIGKETNTMTGQFAHSFKTGYSEAQDSTTFVNDNATANDYTITAAQFKNMKDYGSQVSATVDFERKLTTTDSLVYIKFDIAPFVTENPFTSENRKIPVVFSYPKELLSIFMMEIPEGYEVESMPEQLVISTEDKQCRMQFVPQVMDNKINVSSKFTLSGMTFPAEQYAGLRAFYSSVVEKCNEMIVLRKK